MFYISIKTVIGYDVFANPTATRTLIPHLKNVMNRIECSFSTVIADEGYGSEENYECFKYRRKYTSYETEKKKSFKKKIFNAENWEYNAQQKEYTCPCGNPVPSTDEWKRLMKKRATECETVFGQVKENQKFRRFNLRGKEKVGIEWGLLMIGMIQSNLLNK